MATLGSSGNGRVFYILGLFSLFLLLQRGGAYEFKVGGSSGWSVPSDAQTYTQWAEKNRFQIGDTLLFVYPSDKDSVLQVTKEHYANCTTETPLAKFEDGHTVFKFNQSGPFFFISGTKDNCLKNEKLDIIVLADRSGTKSSPPLPSTPSPAPISDETPAETPPKNAASSAVMSVLGLFGAFIGSSLVLA